MSKADRDLIQAEILCREQKKPEKPILGLGAAATIGAVLGSILTMFLSFGFKAATRFAEKREAKLEEISSYNDTDYAKTSIPPRAQDGSDLRALKELTPSQTWYYSMPAEERKIVGPLTKKLEEEASQKKLLRN